MSGDYGFILFSVTYLAFIFIYCVHCYINQIVSRREKKRIIAEAAAAKAKLNETENADDANEKPKNTVKAEGAKGKSKKTEKNDRNRSSLLS